MNELDRALSQLAFIQDRVAASTRFRGFAPLAVGSSGVLALALASAQTIRPAMLGAHGVDFVWIWVAAAAVSAGMIGVEALERSHRLHGGMADMMVAGTLRLLLPFGAAGAIITLVLLKAAPDAVWILPGLWQLLIALIGFSSASTLPPTIVWPAGWYFACGTVTLILAAQTGTPTPWMMGLPFGIGQLLVAATLYRAGNNDDRN